MEPIVNEFPRLDTGITCEHCRKACYEQLIPSTFVVCPECEAIGFLK